MSQVPLSEYDASHELYIVTTKGDLFFPGVHCWQTSEVGVEFDHGADRVFIPWGDIYRITARKVGP